MYPTKTSTEDYLKTLDVALFAFALSPTLAEEDEVATRYREIMLARTSAEGLRRSSDQTALYAAHRLRLALQLAPVGAIAYQQQNPVPRWRIIHDHLTEEYVDVDSNLLETLARRIAVTLTSWQTQRASTTPLRREVVRRAKNRCHACHFDFAQRSSPALLELDHYKPYFLSPEELTSQEIDHILAISGVGTNDLTNLQLLCRWCNSGKGDGLGVDIRQEARFAAVATADIPRSHIATLFYLVLARDEFLCTHCQGGNELTIRRSHEDRGFVASNLRATCYQCAH
ncbi:HNH endonuclease [Prescottella equi]|uniref:HNH endonuclease n=1 Tax=Rhodococcus hoagii TaxID=43767 RepID=UPI000A10E26A|nr:HNH endonuclease signature motif containing protein [Prescottella equi]